jgi:hypothetical protein
LSTSIVGSGSVILIIERPFSVSLDQSVHRFYDNKIASAELDRLEQG